MKLSDSPEIINGDGLYRAWKKANLSIPTSSWRVPYILSEVLKLRQTGLNISEIKNIYENSMELCA